MRWCAFVILDTVINVGSCNEIVDLPRPYYGSRVEPLFIAHLMRNRDFYPNEDVSIFDRMNAL